MKKKIFLSLLLVATPLLISGGVYVGQARNGRLQAVSLGGDDPALDPHWQELSQTIRRQVNRFPGVAGIVVKDLNRGWTIEYNQDRLFPSASLIKLPVMATLYDAQAQGRISMDDMLAIQRRLKAAGSGHLKFQRVGTNVTIRELIYKMITESDNTATNMLTDLLGLGYYNSHFLRMGLSHTNFSRMVMDLRKRDHGIENYTTPEDMASILERIYRRQLTGSEEMIEILKDQKVNDRLPVAMPSDWQIGHKTGLMRNAVHDVGIVFSPTGDYVICVLTSNTRNIRRAKGFISEVAHLTAIYYTDPSLLDSPERTFWTKAWGRKHRRSVSLLRWNAINSPS